MTFLAEFQRRNVIRAAVLYIGVVWALAQESPGSAAFGMPNRLPRSIVVLLAIGFVPALVLARAYKITPEGIRRAAPATSGAFNSLRACLARLKHRPTLSMDQGDLPGGDAAAFSSASS